MPHSSNTTSCYFKKQCVVCDLVVMQHEGPMARRQLRVTLWAAVIQSHALKHLLSCKADNHAVHEEVHLIVLGPLRIVCGAAGSTIPRTCRGHWYRLHSCVGAIQCNSRQPSTAAAGCMPVMHLNKGCSFNSAVTPSLRGLYAVKGRSVDECTG